MSTAVISYNSLKDASNESKAVAKKLGTYANRLESYVYKKLNDYQGDNTGNIQSAKSNMSNKINSLRNKSQAYSKYAQDLQDLRDECKNTDNSVKTMVSNLTATFKKNNGIRNSKVVNTISYYLTSFGNSSAGGRWLGDAWDAGEAGIRYIKERISYWWGYEGGKQLVKGIAVAILDIGIAIATIAAITFTGGAFAVIVGVAAFIGGTIALANATLDFAAEIEAYRVTKYGLKDKNGNLVTEPATGRRLSKVNTVSDYWRSSFVYGSSGENYVYNKTLNDYANGLDALKFACDVIGFVNTAGNLIKNTYKWASGSMADIKNIRIGHALKDGASSLWSKMKTSIHSISFSNIKNGIKTFAVGFKSDFMNNLKKGFVFKKCNTLKNVSSNLKVARNYVGIYDVLSKDFRSWDDIGDMLWNDIVYPNIGTGEIITYKHDRGGIFDYDISRIKAKDIVDVVVTKRRDLFNKGNKLFEKLSGKSQAKISVPDIYIPEFNFAALKIAA